MRLGQIARKYKVKPKEILESLKLEYEVELDENPNLKLTDDQLEYLDEKFKVEEEVTEEPVTIGNPYKKEEEVIEEKAATVNDEIEAKEDVVVEEPAKVDSEAPKTIEEIEQAVSDFVPEELRESAEVIKAPKIELQGPKVVDKIDLPDSMLNDMIEVDGVMIDRKEYQRKKRAEKDKERAERRAKRLEAKNKAERKKNSDDSLSFEKNREKEIEEERKRIEKNKKKIKEERKKHYLAQHAPKASTTSSKKKANASTNTQQKDEELSVESIEAAFNSDSQPQSEERKLTWWQRLWKWYNT
ncbi:MAG: hypothetical protein MRY83_08330 [Flavobacteriales bacterium]|nr:hypothetical protein [Flavobacteriales bacterium]